MRSSYCQLETSKPLSQQYSMNLAHWMVIILARASRGATGAKVRRISNRKRILMATAFVGLAIVILSQGDLEFDGILERGAVLGLVFAALSGLFASISGAANLRYGDLMSAHYVDVHRLKTRGGSNAAEDTGHNDNTEDPHAGIRVKPAPKAQTDAQNVWLSVAGLAIASILIVPVNLFFYLVIPLETGASQGLT